MGIGKSGGAQGMTLKQRKAGYCPAWHTCSRGCVSIAMHLIFGFMADNHYYVLYKPYGVLSQFSRPEPHHKTLADFFHVPKDVYPVGRLDKDSEGLLLLTNDKRLNQHLLNPQHKRPKTYWVQVEGTPTDADLAPLRTGLTIKLKQGPYHTMPAQAKILDPRPAVPERDPPVRFRKTVPDTWLEMVLHEGKNRQVRKMTAAIGFPTLRLIRVGIGNYKLPVLEPGWISEKFDIFSM